MLKNIFGKKEINKDDLLKKLKFENLSSLLYSMKVIQKEFGNAQRICIEIPMFEKQSKRIDLNSSSETLEEKLIQTSLFRNEINVNKLFSLYNSNILNEEGVLYLIDEFSLVLNIFVLIMKNFNDELFHYNFSKKDIFLGEKRVKILTYNNSSYNRKFTGLLDKLYHIIENCEELLRDDNMKNLFFVFHIITFFGNVSYSEINIDNILEMIDIFSKVIFSDLKLTILIYLHIVVLMNLNNNNENINIESNQNKKRALPISEIIPMFYYIENNIHNENKISKTKAIIHIGNIIKLHLIPYLLEKVDLEVNIKVINEIDIPNELNNFDNDNNNNEIQIDSNFVISLEEVLLLTVNLLKVNSFYFQVSPSATPELVELKIKKFYNIILLSKNLFVEVYNNQRELMFPIENFANEMNVLYLLLDYIKSIKNAKNKKQKNSKINFSFNFSSFSLSIEKTINITKKEKTRDIMLLLNQKHYSENNLLDYISKEDGVTDLTSKLIIVLQKLSIFKKYSIGLRITQNEFANKELLYYFCLVYLKIQNYIIDHSTIYKKVVLFETKVISPNSTIIVSNTDKLKNKMKIPSFTKSLNNFTYTNMKFLNSFYPEFYMLFGKIIIFNEVMCKHPFNPRLLLRNFKENIIVIIGKENGDLDLLIYLYNSDNCKYFHGFIIDIIKRSKKNSYNAKFFNRIVIITERKSFINEIKITLTNMIYSRLVNEIYLIDEENKIDVVMLYGKIVIYHREKVNDYFIQCTNDINKCYEIIQNILMNSLINFNNISFVFEDIIINLKQGCLIVKKFYPKNITYSSLLYINIFSPEMSYPVMLLLPHKEQRHNFSITSFLLLYKEYLFQLPTITKDIILNFIISKIIKDALFYITPIVFNEQYLNHLINFFSETQLKLTNYIYLPISLKKQPIYSKMFEISDKVTIFQFVKSKLNFNVIIDVGRSLTVKKFSNTMNQLITNNKTKKISSSADKRICNISLFNASIVCLITYLEKKNCEKSDIKSLCMGILKYIDFKDNKKIEGRVDEYFVQSEIISKEIWKIKKGIKANKKKDENFHIKLRSETNNYPQSTNDLDIKSSKSARLTESNMQSLRSNLLKTKTKSEDIFDKDCMIY